MRGCLLLLLLARLGLAPTQGHAGCIAFNSELNKEKQTLHLNATLSSYLQGRRTGELNEEPPMYFLSCLLEFVS